PVLAPGGDEHAVRRRAPALALVRSVWIQPHISLPEPSEAVLRPAWVWPSDGLMLDVLALIVPVLLVSLVLRRPPSALLQPWRGLAATVLALVVVLPTGWWVIKATDVQLMGEVVSRVDTPQRVVALTFDDGPRPEAAEEVARVLRARQVKATFFLNGEDVA